MDPNNEVNSELPWFMPLYPTANLFHGSFMISSLFYFSIFIYFQVTQHTVHPFSINIEVLASKYFKKP